MEEVYIQLLREKLSEIRDIAEKFGDKTLSGAVREFEATLDHAKKILREKTNNTSGFEE